MSEETNKTFILAAVDLIEQLDKLLKEAETKGFKNGMLHSAEVFRDSLVNSRHMVEAAAMHECIDRLRKEVQGE